MKLASHNPSSLLALEVLQQFRQIFGSLRQYFRLVEERCGMPGSWMWLLQEVERNPAIGIGELAVRMGIHQSTCSLMADKLVARGCLTKQRNGRDQRRVGLVLTEVGQAALAALPGPAEGILPEALANLPEVVLKTLNINLDELIRLLPGKVDGYAETPLADMLGPDDGERRRDA